MPLAPGVRLGPYEILAPIGAGGMGEVYRARDSKLNRDVAIKVLPELFTADPDRLARFRREAQVLASLNHQNIGHIYGLEDSGDTHALVLELVEGPTLADRMEQGAIPLEDALPIARQIADALECAHEQGVVHRDLKPANIKVRDDGTVKVLDFGLAKALDAPGETGSGAVINSPTLTARATQMGLIIGTAAYMAPEQARGRTVDRRADIWAFGVVLYEMLTGKRAFEGDDISITLAAVLKDDVKWAELPADLPPSVRRVLRRCLEKDPKRRLSAIADARLELEDSAEPPAAVQVAPVPRARWLQAAPWIIAALAVVAALTAVVLWKPWQPQAERPVARVTADPGAEGSLAVDLGAAAVISPDGKTVVFVLESGGRNMLHVRRVDQLRATQLQGTEDAFGPFFSPDSQWIGFFTPGKLKKVAATGGALVTLCDAASGRGGAWGDDDTIVFQPTGAPGAILHRVSAAGGTPSAVGTLAEGEGSRRWPQILPGGKAVLYSSMGASVSWDDADLMVQRLEGGHPRVILRGGYHARYVKPGHLLYIRESVLFAVPFDPERLELRGTPVPMVEGVLTSGSTGAAHFSIAESGTLVYLPGRGSGTQMPVSWMDEHGKTAVLRAEPSDWSQPRFSPDGNKLAMTIGVGPTSDVWVYEWAKDTLTKLTFGSGWDYAPVWTPDGRRIAYASARDEKATTPANVLWKRSDGTGAAQRLTDSPHLQVPHSFHPSGKYLAFTERRPETGLDIMLLPLEGDENRGWKVGTPTVFAGTPATEGAPAFSPDGRWIAYAHTEAARSHIYVRPFAGGEGQWKISTDAGGVFPVWSRAGRELFYVVPGGQNIIMAVEYEVEGESFRAGRPRRWSPGVLLPIRGSRPYDVHPDGQRIAMLKPPETMQQQAKPVFVFNFTEELRRIAAAR